MLIPKNHPKNLQTDSETLMNAHIEDLPYFAIYREPQFPQNIFIR